MEDGNFKTSLKHLSNSSSPKSTSLEIFFPHKNLNHLHPFLLSGLRFRTINFFVPSTVSSVFKAETIFLWLILLRSLKYSLKVHLNFCLSASVDRLNCVINFKTSKKTGVLRIFMGLILRVFSSVKKMVTKFFKTPQRLVLESCLFNTFLKSEFNSSLLNDFSSFNYCSCLGVIHICSLGHLESDSCITRNIL